MSSLQDLVVIREPAPTIAGLNHPTYSVHFIRRLNNDDLDELLKGKLLDDFEPSHVVFKGEIIPQSGAPGSVPSEVAACRKGKNLAQRCADPSGRNSTT